MATPAEIAQLQEQGLYSSQNEHDACGVGFVANIKGKQSHDLVAQGLQILRNLDHRGACGCEVNTGDGAGILRAVGTKPTRIVVGSALAGAQDSVMAIVGWRGDGTLTTPVAPSSTS